MRHFQRRRQVVFGHGEAVILRGDFDAARFQVLHRLIGAAVAELELEGLGAAGQRQQLVPQADAEHGRLAQQPRIVSIA